MSNPSHVDRSRLIIDLVHNTVISHTNPPFFVAACEFLAAGGARGQCQSFETRDDASNHLSRESV
jgi:hypothetical protein